MLLMTKLHKEPGARKIEPAMQAMGKSKINQFKLVNSEMDRPRYVSRAEWLVLATRT